MTWATSLLVVTLTLAGAQTGPAQEASLRTGVISGMVVDDAGTPVGRVWLGLTSAELPGARTTQSDDEGRFSFGALPAGRFRLLASKPFYLNSEFGQRAADDLATTIRLAEAQRFTEVRLRLPRTASISGRFVDSQGKPVSVTSFGGAPVEPEARLRPGPTPSRRLNQMSLDGAGGFRMERLAPGTYDLRASRHSPVVSITVRDGERVNDVVLPLVPTANTKSSIEGVITGPDGRPMTSVEFQLVSLDADPPETHYLRGVPRADDQGRFTLTDIPIGRYALLARTAIFERPPGRPSTFLSYWASTEVYVAADVAAHVQLTLVPGVTIRGRIEFDGSTLTPPPLPRTQLQLVPSDGLAASSHAVPGNVSGSIASDGSFSIRGVPPGRYTIRLSAFQDQRNLMDGWSLESAVLGGVDALDVPFTVGDKDVESLIITVSDRVGRIEGTVGSPTESDSTVVVFPADPKLWTRTTRRIRAVKPDTAGSFELADLPAGEYLVAAASLAPYAWLDPVVLESLQKSARRVALVRGQSVHMAITTFARRPMTQ